MGLLRTKRQAVYVKKETSYGVDAVPDPSSDNALEVQGLVKYATTPYFDVIERGDKDYPLGLEYATGIATITFSVPVREIADSSLSDHPLLSCGFDYVYNAGASHQFTHNGNNDNSATIYFYNDGMLYKILGARGKAKIEADRKGKPLFIEYEFTGLDGGATAVAFPTVTYDTTGAIQTFDTLELASVIYRGSNITMDVANTLTPIEAKTTAGVVGEIGITGAKLNFDSDIVPEDTTDVTTLKGLEGTKATGLKVNTDFIDTNLFVTKVIGMKDLKGAISLIVGGETEGLVVKIPTQ